MSWWMILIVVWLVSIPLTFYVETRNSTIIRMGDVWLMVIFGPFHFILNVSRLDTIVWEKKKKVESE